MGMLLQVTFASVLRRHGSGWRIVKSQLRWGGGWCCIALTAILLALAAWFQITSDIAEMGLHFVYVAIPPALLGVLILRTTSYLHIDPVKGEVDIGGGMENNARFLAVLFEHKIRNLRDQHGRAQQQFDFAVSLVGSGSVGLAQAARDHLREHNADIQAMRLYIMSELGRVSRFRGGLSAFPVTRTGNGNDGWHIATVLGGALGLPVIDVTGSEQVIHAPDALDGTTCGSPHR